MWSAHFLLYHPTLWEAKSKSETTLLIYHKSKWYRKEKFSQTHHISAFSSRNGCGQSLKVAWWASKQGNWVNQSLMCLSEKAGNLSHDCDEFPFKNGNTHPLGYRILQLFLLHRWTFRKRQRCFEMRVTVHLLLGSTWISVMSIFPGDFPFISAFRTDQIFLLNDTRFFK